MPGGSADGPQGHANRCDPRPLPIDQTIADLEEKLETIAADIEKHFSEYLKVTELMALQSETQQMLDEAMERWMFLQEKREQIQTAQKN